MHFSVGNGSRGDGRRKRRFLSAIDGVNRELFLLEWRLPGLSIAVFTVNSRASTRRTKTITTWKFGERRSRAAVRVATFYLSEIYLSRNQ